MSSFQIFDGASATQAFRVVNMKKCKKTADIAVNDTALEILRAAITMNNVLDQPWAFAVLFGKPFEAGFDEPRAALEQHPLLHMTNIDDSVVISVKYGGIGYSNWELVGTEDTDVQEPSSQSSGQTSLFPTAGVPPRISTSKNSRHGSGTTSNNMDARSRLRLKYEKQLQDKNLALWFALQKKHKSIAARKPRGTYKTTQEDYWLDVFIQVFPDMLDDERAARLTILKGLEDVEGNGWEAKWRSFASVQAYQPAEAAIDAEVWGPVFSHLSKGFEEYMPKPGVKEQFAKPTRVYPSCPFPQSTPPFASQQLSALKGFDKPTFSFLTNKEAAPTLSTLSARTETSSPPTSVLQQPLPLFSAPSLFSNIGSNPIAPTGLDLGETFNKTLPLGLQKPWKGVSTSVEPKSNSTFIFDCSKLSGTVFSPQASGVTTPFVFGASSGVVAMSEVDYTTDYQSEDDSSEVHNGISAEFLEDALSWTYHSDLEVELEDISPVAQLLPSDDTATLEETSSKEAQLAPYTVGEYLTDNITYIFRHCSELSRAVALEEYAALNEHYGVGLSSPCPPTWTRPSSILKWSEVVENFETDFVELTMPGATQSEKHGRVTFLMNELKASIGEAWDTMDDVEPLPARVEITISQDGDNFEDDAMCAYVNGYYFLAQREYDASRSETAITDEQYTRREPASHPSSVIEVTVGQAGDKFGNDAMYSNTNGYELLAQCEYGLSALPCSSPVEITVGPAGPMFEDDAMYGDFNAYELLAEREYYSTDGKDESDGDDTSLPSSIDSPVSSPERPLSPDDGMYAIFELRNDMVHLLDVRMEVFELDGQDQTWSGNIVGQQVDSPEEARSPVVTTVHPFGTPEPLTLPFDVTDKTDMATENVSEVEQDTLIVFDDDSSASDNETIVGASDDEGFGYAKIVSRTVPHVPRTRGLSDGLRMLNLEPFKDMRDWATTFCDEAFAAPSAPQLPKLQLETTAFSSLFDSDMMFGTPNTPEDLNYVLPELSEFSTPLSAKICTDQALSSPGLAINKDKLISDLIALVAEFEHNDRPSTIPTFLVTPPEAERSPAYYKRINEAWAPTPPFTHEDYKLRVSER